MYLGDYDPAKTLYFSFPTRDGTGALVTLSGTPAVKVYKNGSSTESAAGVSLSVDFDSLTGNNLVTIDLSADGTFYAAACDFMVKITAGTVGGVSVVGEVVAHFSIRNRSPLMPTTAGRTLDVSSGGEAGLDWANVGSPTTSLALTGTTIAITQKVDVETIKTQAVTCAAGVTVLASVGTAATSTAQTGDSYARIGAPAGASISADVAAAKADTAAIKVKTDSLTFTVSGYVDANTLKVGGTTQTARDIGASVLLSNGTGTGQLKLASGYVAMTWADIAAPTTSVNLSGTTVATVTNQLTAATIAAGLLDLANGVETGYTMRQTLRLMAAVLLGTSDEAGGDWTYKSMGGSTDRVVATSTGGVRTATTLTP